MLHHVACKRERIIAADSWARVKALPARKKDEAPCSDFTLQSPQIRSKFCRGRARKQAWDPARAEHRCRAKALVRTKAATLGIPLGPNPCQGKDQHRHAREFNATRRRLQGPKRPGSLARSGSRSGLAKASEAALGTPLGIPLGANADATQRRHSCGSHTVSTRQTLLHLVWPCQPGLFALRLPTRFSYSTCRFLQGHPSCLDN